MVKKSWRTVGFFLENTAEQRLVYEILLVPLRKVCVLRVYWEQPLTVLYARKFSTRANEPSVALHEASRIFVASAGEIRTSLGDSERMSGMIGKMPKSIQSLLTKVLVPVPPPVDLEAIQDAEPTSPDDVANRSAPEK